MVPLDSSLAYELTQRVDGRSLPNQRKRQIGKRCVFALVAVPRHGGEMPAMPLKYGSESGIPRQLVELGAPVLERFRAALQGCGPRSGVLC